MSAPIVRTPAEIRERQKQAVEAHKKAIRELWKRLVENILFTEFEKFSPEKSDGLLSRELVLDKSRCVGTGITLTELYNWATAKKTVYPGWTINISYDWPGACINIKLKEVAEEPKT